MKLCGLVIFKTNILSSVLRMIAPTALYQAEAGQDVSQGQPSSLCLWSDLWVDGEAAPEVEATLD